MNDSIHTETLKNGFEFEMLQVKGGLFQMGSTDSEADEDEQPEHEVKLSSFYIGKYPVTQGLWKSVLGGDNNPSRWPDDDRRPVEKVSWKDTQEFIKELNKKSGQTYRLPTEAEWEYAARGGNESRGYKYSGSNKIDEVAWYAENSHQETKPVGLKLPNELGLYDMSGNVYEWCEDEWHGNYEGAPENGKAWFNEADSDRVLRGGGWSSDPQLCRSTYRLNYDPEDSSYSFGFRLVLSLQ